MSGYSISHWMDIWLTDFCDSNPVSILILFLSLSVHRSAKNSRGCLWYLSRRPLILLLLMTFISLPFIYIALFSVIWVCLGHESHDEVSKSLENRPLIWFSKEIPGNLICGAPFHWHVSFVNPVSHKKIWCLYVWWVFWLMTYHYFPEEYRSCFLGIWYYH